jgi:hypothetical protein
VKRKIKESKKRETIKVESRKKDLLKERKKKRKRKCI